MKLTQNLIITSGLIVGSLIFVFSGQSGQMGAFSVQAQTSEFVYQGTSLTAELRRLKTQYRGELEEYRRLEKQYQVNKQQYQQLQTLTSLEEAVNAAQVAMESRARVLTTYLEILRVSLLDQTGIEVEQKELALDRLQSVRQQLAAHHQPLTVVELDKVTLNQTAIEFVGLGEQIEDVSYQVLSLLAVGQLQTTHDKSQLLLTDMEAELATQGGALQIAKRKRSFEETQRRLEVIRPILQEIHAEIKDGKLGHYKNVYHRIDESLQDVFTQLSQVLAYLEELLTL